MVKVWILARTTLREMLRERVFLVVLLIALALQSFSLLLGTLSLAEQKKILADFGFLAIQVAVLAASLFFGAYLINKEIEKQTCLLILSRPVTRAQFLMGKVVGLLVMNGLLAISLAILLFLLLRLWQSPSSWLTFVEICIGLWMESAVILSLVLLFSLLVRPVLALTMGLMAYLLGNSLEDIQFFAQKSQDQMFIEAAKSLEWFTPNFYKFNWKSALLLESGIPAQNFFWMCAHMTGWSVLLLLFAILFFRRKDIV